MAIPPRTLGRPAPGNTNYQGTGAPEQQLDLDYDKDNQGKNRGGSATNKNVNTVKGGNVTIGDVGSNNVTRINAKNKAQEFKKKKEAAESEEAKADTDADVSNETEREQEKDERIENTKVRTADFQDGNGNGIDDRDERDRPSGFPERLVTVRNPDGSKGGFRDYGYGGPTDRRDSRAGRGGDANFGYLYGGSGGYNFNRGGGRTPMRRGAGIRRTGRG